MKKLVILAPRAYAFFDPQNAMARELGIGGAEVQLCLLARDLADRKAADVHIVVADCGQGDQLVRDGITLHVGFSFRDSSVRAMTDLMSCLWRVHGDVYIQRAIHEVSGILAIVFRFSRAKFVYMVAHDGETDNSPIIYRNRFIRLGGWLVFRLADRVVVQNQYEWDQLWKRVRASRLAMLCKGVVVPRNEVPAKSEYDAVWAGRCVAWKRPDLFLRLAARSPDLRFLMLCPKGPEPTPYQARVRTHAARLPNVDFVDFVSPGDMCRQLSRGRAFCLTSKQEGDWPMVALEAAAVGVPVVSYGINPGLLIDRYGGGALCNGRVGEMEAWIRRLRNEPSVWSAMSQAARRFIASERDIRVCADRLLAIL